MDECNHFWQQTRVEGVEKCTRCGDRFPCRQDCGHIDCWERKNRVCYACGKPVAENEEFTLELWPRGAARFAHNDCANPEKPGIYMKVY